MSSILMQCVPLINMTYHKPMGVFWNTLVGSDEWEICIQMLGHTLHTQAILSGVSKTTMHVCRRCVQHLDVRSEHMTAFTRMSLVLLRSLHILNFSHNIELTSDHLRSLTALKHLRELDLSFCKGVTDDGLSSIGSLRELRVLNLHGCSSITDRSMMSLSKMVRIQNIDLSGCAITGYGLHLLTTLREVKSLDLSRCHKLTDVDMLELTAFTDTLIELKLHGGFRHIVNRMRITDKGLISIGQLYNLRVLDLGICETMTDTGIQSLCTLTELHILNLDHAVHITSIPALTHLIELSLRNCRSLSDTSIRSLAMMTNLRTLSLSRCRLHYHRYPAYVS
jgi:F-box/leucine-rich repeat protein 14